MAQRGHGHLHPHSHDHVHDHTHPHSHNWSSIEDQKLIKERLLRNREIMKDFVYPRGVVTYVPVKFQLIGNNDGTNRVKENVALDMLCLLNESFEDQDIQFYISNGFRYLNSTLINNNSGSSAGFDATALNRVNNAINVYVTADPGLDGAAAYYAGQSDIIVVGRSFAYGESVFPHEVGHFFSLPHPFFGWDEEAWDPNVHGMQVGFTSPGGILNDRADLVNCENTGDGICDTPPDYQFANSPGQVGCNEFNGGAMDPVGVVVDPMEDNIMSYFNNCDGYVFTNGQKDAVIADLFSPGRAYIRPNYTPNTAEITEEPVLTSPVGGEVTNSYDEVVLDWTEVDGADQYLVEIDIWSSFTIEPKLYITDQTFLELNDLDSDRRYFWRVRPFNEYYTCTSFSDDTEFTTGIASSTTNIKEIEALTVTPNPVSTSQQLMVQVEATSAFQAQVNLLDLTGRVLQSNAIDFATGRTNQSLDISQLSAGIYLLSIQSKDGISNQKFVVTQ